MARHAHLTGRFGRRRGWPRRTLVTLLVLVAVGAGAFWYLTRPTRLAGLASALLADMTDAEVRIASARLGSDGSVHLQGVELRVPGGTSDADRLFTADRVLLEQDLLSLFTGKFRATSLTLLEPTIYLTEEADGRFNFQRLPRETKPKTDKKKQLPDIFVRSGGLRVGTVEGNKYVQTSSVRASGNLTAESSNRGLYYYTLRADTGAGDNTVFTGTLDLDRKAYSGTLKGFAIHGPQRNLLPRKIRDWWDRLEPSGELPTVSFSFDPDGGLDATLVLQNGEITLPKEFIAARTTNVTGKFTVKGETITVSELSGKVLGIPYVVNGTIDGMDQGAPFNLTVRLDEFQIPDESEYIDKVAEKYRNKVRKPRERFVGTGRFKGLVVLSREKREAGLKVDGSAQIVDASGSYNKFPYPLQKIHGEIRFDNTQIKIVSLNGQGLNGGSVNIQGAVTPPGDGAAVDLIITAVDIPVDEHARNALKEKHREVLDWFIDVPAHTALQEQGLILTEAGKAERLARIATLTQARQSVIDEAQGAGFDREIAELKQSLDRPVFDLSGRINVTAKVTRALGKGQPIQTASTIQTRGFNVLFKYFPYPLRLTSGKIHIEKSTITTEGIEAVGLTGATGRADGEVLTGEGGVRPQIRLAAVNMPIDDLLIAAIPPSQAKWLRDLGLSGTVDAGGAVFRNDQDKIDFKIETKLRDGSATPFGGAYTLNKLAGTAEISRRRVDLTDITGERDATWMKITGHVAKLDTTSPGGVPDTDILIKATGVNLRDPVLDLIPPGTEGTEKIRELFAHHKPDGQFDADFTLQSDDAGERNFALELRPYWLSFGLRGERVMLSKIGGGLRVTKGGLEFKDFAADFDSGRVKSNGTLTFGEEPSYDVTFDADNNQFGPVIRSSLPSNVTKVLDALELAGAYQIRGAHLKWRPKATGQHPTLDFTGKVRLIDATATVGVPIAKLNGEMGFDVKLFAGEQWPRVNMSLAANHLTAADRLIAPLSLQIVSSQDPGVLEIRDMRGSVYGGTLLGSGSVSMADQGRYRISLTVQDAMMDPVVHPDKYPLRLPLVDLRAPSTQPSDRSAIPTGVLSASLAIEGVPNNVSERSGRGRLEIRNANLYELPLAMTLLQIVNLSLPASRSFDRASADYLLYGDTVKLDAVTFEAPTVRMEGSGELTYSTLDLSLDLYSRNPSAPSLGPISEVLSSMKDELIQIHVGGKLNDPKASVQSLNTIKGGWRQVFGEPEKSATGN